jgi:hypothetical protein
VLAHAPDDDTRFLLPGVENDYINANWVKYETSHGVFTYLAAQVCAGCTCARGAFAGWRERYDACPLVLWGILFRRGRSPTRAITSGTWHGKAKCG